uniref:Uncharacterized protein n=1 Tax=Oryza punctata TaxID=4537 RepID=A0A0E0K3H2_ORYPU
MAMGRIGCSGMKRPPPPPLVDFVADHPSSGITPWEAQLGQIMFSNLCEQLYGGPWRFARAAWHYRGNSGCYKVTIFFPFTLTDVVTKMGVLHRVEVFVNKSSWKT